MLASGLCASPVLADPGEPPPVVPADALVGRDVRGRPVVPADLPTPAETRGDARRLRVWTRPPAGPWPVEVEIALPDAPR